MKDLFGQQISAFDSTDKIKKHFGYFRHTASRPGNKKLKFKDIYFQKFTKKTFFHKRSRSIES